MLDAARAFSTWSSGGDAQGDVEPGVSLEDLGDLSLADVHREVEDSP